MKTHYYKIFICYLLCFLNWSLFAKEFKLISLDNFGKIQQLQFQSDSGEQTLNIRKYYPNRSFTVPKNNLIHFYGINSATGDSSKKPLLRISFANQKGDSIVLLELDKNNPGKINYKFLKNDPNSFPPLSAAILNLSDKPIMSKFGNKVIKISPKSQKFVPLSKNEKGTFNEKVVFAAQKKDKSIDYFYSSVWRVPAGRKTFCIIDADNEGDTHNLVQLLF